MVTRSRVLNRTQSPLLRLRDPSALRERLLVSRSKGGGGGYLLEFAQGAFTRTGEAAAVDPRQGKDWYDTAIPFPGTDIARFAIFETHDGPRPGTLFEHTATNLIVESRDLSAWSLVGTPILVGSQSGPSGASDSYSIQDDDGAALEGVSDTVSVSSSQAYTLSCYVLKDSDVTRFPVFRILGNVSANDHRLMLNTSTGAVIAMTGFAAWQANSVRVLDAGSWWKLEGTIVTGVSDTSVDVFVYPAGGSVWDSMSNAATGTITVSELQLDSSRIPSSPILTLGTTETRNADVLSLSPAQWTSLASSNSYALYYLPMWSNREPGDIVNERRFLIDCDTSQGEGGIYWRWSGSNWSLNLNFDGLGSQAVVAPAGFINVGGSIRVLVDHNTGVCTATNELASQISTPALGAGGFNTGLDLYVGSSEAGISQAAAVVTQPEFVS